MGLVANIEIMHAYAFFFWGGGGCWKGEERGGGLNTAAMTSLLFNCTIETLSLLMSKSQLRIYIHIKR